MIESSPSLWKVAVDAPLPQLLTYSSELALSVGQLVEVPLGKRSTRGLVVRKEDVASDKFKIKAVLSLLEEFPQLTKGQLNWALWVAHYYHYPPGEVFSLFFPQLAKKGRIPANKSLFSDAMADHQVTLNPEQQKVVNDVAAFSGFSSHLLWGVTGSGKTEVYIELIKKQLEQGRSAMVLVPEIALTPQLISRFRQRLGENIAVLHSNLTDRERTNQWWSVIEKKNHVLIGVRSALFCPVPDLGLIVVDEEHEGSYKQDEKLRYNARDSAVMRALHEKIPVILGTATPSAESWKNVLDKKYHLHELKQRASRLQIPRMEIIDLQTNKDDANRDPLLPYWLSTPLYEALAENYKTGFQSALFLNRRGIAQTVLCNDCGFIYKCPNCEISLTLHGKNHLVCHYCDYSQAMAYKCPDCRVGTIKPIGLGTEQIQNDVQKLFPQANIMRVDRDEIDSRERMEDFVAKMESQEVQILVGTQMIAKGLDFKNLTLVGVVLADIGFHIPDFRASERSFQLLTQVSGRSGRHHPGAVFVQTYRPDHPSLIHAQKQDVAGFLNAALEERKELSYPPYFRMACLKISGLDEKEVRGHAQNLSLKIKTYAATLDPEVKVLGPAPAPLFKLRQRYRFQILLKSASLQSLDKALQYVTHLSADEFKKLRIQIDMDPYNLM